ncbi:MAG TPA: nucleotide exchange factor GrpE, partial [Candidatus Bathyarchaeia archaeon]|nr:nucleotide exchange factor GrpE [Candidatus Bathyarchaeia archaeon]
PPAEDPKKGKAAKETEEESEPGTTEDVTQAEAALKLEQSKSDDLFRRLQYLQADFENFRKRAEKEMGDVKKYGNERLLSDLLTVKDELELALAKAQESKQNPVLLDGVGMVLKRLTNLLSKEGVEKIQSVGSKFNPEYEEAALRVPSDEDEDTVVEEVRPGYLLKGRVLRPSIVKVAEKMPEEQSESEEKKE